MLPVKSLYNLAPLLYQLLALLPSKSMQEFMAANEYVYKVCLLSSFSYSGVIGPIGE